MKKKDKNRAYQVEIQHNIKVRNFKKYGAHILFIQKVVKEQIAIVIHPIYDWENVLCIEEQLIAIHEGFVETPFRICTH